MYQGIFSPLASLLMVTMPVPLEPAITKLLLVSISLMELTLEKALT
jgi:hypothetical protein